MKNRMTKLASIVLALMLCLQLAVPAMAFNNHIGPPAQLEVLQKASLFSASLNNEDILPIADAADVYTESGAINSIQYAMMKDGEIILDGVSGTNGDRELNSDNIYCVGSISKTYTATMVMKLVEEGKIALDTPVTKYIPEFTMADPRYKDITVRMLLNHSSGLMGSTYNDGLLWDDNSTAAHDTLLEDFKTQRLKADPGAFSVYCNDGYSLAEILLEKVSGKSYTQLLSELITTPLGAESTFTPLSDFDRNDMARTFYGGDLQLEQKNEIANIIGTGGVLSTASELCLFGTIFTGEAKILSDKSLEAMSSKEFLRGQWIGEDEDNIIGYGLGWDSVDLYPFNRLGIKALVKGGDTVNYHASLVVLPEYNMSAAVTSSAGASTYCQMMAVEMLLSQLIEDGVIKERPYVDAPTVAQKALDKDFGKYEGYYANYGQLLTLDFESEGVLNFGSPYDPDYSESLIYGGDGSFYSEDGTIEVYFLEQNGNTYFMQKTIMNMYGIGQVVMNIYGAQQLPENILTDEVFEAWSARNGIPYLAVNMKYNSLNYSYGLPALGSIVFDKEMGYLSNAKITDANNALAAVQIPIMGGRDLHDFGFNMGTYVTKETEFSVYSDLELVSYNSILPIFGGKTSQCTILEDGYARWYSIGNSLDGKTITVDMPSNSGFSVYDANGMLINQSAMSGDNTATLKAGGLIVFAGNPGDKFTISIG